MVVIITRKDPALCILSLHESTPIAWQSLRNKISWCCNHIWSWSILVRLNTLAKSNLKPGRLQVSSTENFPKIILWQPQLLFLLKLNLSTVRPILYRVLLPCLGSPLGKVYCISWARGSRDLHWEYASKTSWRSDSDTLRILHQTDHSIPSLRSRIKGLSKLRCVPCTRL
jgi:hypothetical protein